MATPSASDATTAASGTIPQLVLPPVTVAPRIQLYEVLNGETDPPFTFPAFIAYLNKQHAEENIEFYDAVVQYRKAARQLSNRIAQQQAQRESSVASASPSPSAGSPPSSAGPTAATSPISPQFKPNEKNNRRRRSSVFVSIAEMESQPLLNQSVSSVGNNNGRRGSIGFQNSILFDSSLASLPNGSQLKTLLDLQEGGAEGEEARILTERLGKLREKLERIVEIFLNEGAPKEINIPGNIRDQILHEIRVNKNYDPKIFKAAMENLYNSMKGNLMGFRNEGEKLLKAARNNAIKISEDDRNAVEEENEAIPSFLAGPEEARVIEMRKDQKRRMSTVPDFVRTGPGAKTPFTLPPPIPEANISSSSAKQQQQQQVNKSKK